MAAWPYPRVLAHRGGGRLAPENTLPALDTGLRHGYRAAEIDAVLTADEVPVLLHDADLDRTTSGRGSIARWEARELESLDAGAWFGAQFAGTRIPTLRTALAHCEARGIWLNIEIKPVAGFERRTGEVVARTVADFLADPGMAAAPLLSSFSPVALEAARAAAPQLARGLLVTHIPADWEQRLAALQCRSLHCQHEHLSAALAARIGAAGYGILCYTVNDAARAAQLRQWGVDAICTDAIDEIDPAH